MSFDIVRAWKDEAYRQSLTETELAQLPASPIGAIELGDDELDQAHGGIQSILLACATILSQGSGCENNSNQSNVIGIC